MESDHFDKDGDRFSNEAARIGDFRRRIVRHVQCRSCGFEPPAARPAACPKCGGGCWESYVQVGKLRPATSHDRPPVAKVPASAGAD
jgi:hypothetical protein